MTVEPGDDNGKQGVAALERALSILEAFRDDSLDQAKSLAELASSTGLYKSTILRLCVSLERFGYLKRLEDGKFALGPSTFQLGQNYQRSFLQFRDVRPILQELVATTQETAALWILEGMTRICLMRIDTPRPIRDTSIREGDRLPLDGGATSKILRAFADGGTIGGADRRDALLAISEGGYLPELAGMSRPVFGTGDRFAAALTLAGPVSRFTPAAMPGFEAALSDAAARITGILGGASTAAATAP